MLYVQLKLSIQTQPMMDLLTTGIFVVAIFISGSFAQFSNAGNFHLSFGGQKGYSLGNKGYPLGNNGYSFGNKGYSNSFVGGFGNHLGKINNVPYVSEKEKDKLKLVGRTIIKEPLHQDRIPKTHGIAATISETSNVVSNSPFGDAWYGAQAQLGGKGLSLKLEVQTSTPGYYHVVFTSLAKVNEGCSKKTLGNILEYSHMSSRALFSLYGTLTSSHLPEGVIADIELGRNIPKTLHINRLKNFNSLKDLAGRGIAVCQTDKKSGNNNRPCRGAIVVCTDLSYSDHEATLGYVEPPQHRPDPPINKPTQFLPPPRSANDLPPDEYYSKPHKARPYFDLDTEPYYDEDNEILETYNPPPPPPEADYDPYGNDVNREPIFDQPFVYESMARPHQQYRSDREFGLGQNFPRF